MSGGACARVLAGRADTCQWNKLEGLICRNDGALNPVQMTVLPWTADCGDLTAWRQHTGALLSDCADSSIAP